MFVTPLFKLMSEKQASDIFFTAGAPIQIKINGVVMPINNQPLDVEQARKICYELMSDAQVKEFETRHEMNFAQSEGELGNFRVNIFRQKNTVAMVIRFVKPEVPPFESLGLPAILKEVIMEKIGLVLVVGSTGSGKSTTMAAMIDHRNTIRTGHILTIEDPIEFMFKHKKSIVNQREVRIDTHTYENALISAMREAPDLLMIGEIRDRPTLQSALLFAQTGHLCMTTLHANNSYNALNRIINFFPREARESLLADLAIALRCIISQRLVRTVDGGRVAAVEVLLNTKHIQELIKDGELGQIKEALDQSLAPGSQSFEQALYQLYMEGKVTLEEGMANADSPTNLHWLVNNAPKSAAQSQAASAPSAPVTGRPAQDDLSSIRINLDALG
ncbi:MAG: type IV pili twitching motility protein PilT [Betaproteobacteria bacterium RIFCSPLOWO2_02_64_14]|nr:MAG: type IV pili twitching motility protein PilT [Betaproteobacteria bacterium RIFCSPLOWO2_02_64_14]